MKKRIIVLCDGTWNDLEMRYITNVGRLAQILDGDGRSGRRDIAQLIYYDDGVAANDSGITRMWNGAFGGGMERNIYEAYRFLVFNYVPGDEVCLLGFSRGAYTVRSLAGMIGRVGLVSKAEMKFVPQALETYRLRGPKAKQQQAQFRRDAHSTVIDIDLLGCWDTVGARGIPDKLPWLPLDDWLGKKYRFHDTDLGANVKHALHAVAIDEQRKEFDVTPMHRVTRGQTLQQVWFPGDHGSVGGGSWEKRGLSNRCLQWMLEESRRLGFDFGISEDRLEEQAVSDPGIFYHAPVGFPYSKKARKLPTDWKVIDPSAHVRWLENPKLVKGAVRRNFGAKIARLPKDGTRQPRSAAAELAVGESAAVRVVAEEKRNASRVLVRQGQRFEIRVGRLQVWKDGDLDPCDVLGWSLSDPDKHPWSGGEKADLGWLKEKFIRRFRSKRLVPEADWFELVASLDGAKFFRLPLRRPSGATDDFVVRYRATADGELAFAANDAASNWDALDTYDNNKGWVWLEVVRTS